MDPETPAVIVSTFSQPQEAHVARSALTAAGIESWLSDEHIVSANWMYSNAVGGVKLLVRAEEAETAREVLGTTASSQPAADETHLGHDQEAIVCPRCGSHDVARRWLGRRLSFLSWLLAGFPVIPALRRTPCHRCGHAFD